MSDRERPSPTDGRTLVLAPNWVGDTVLALPVLDALASSGRRTTVLASPHLHPLLRLSPSVDSVIAKGVSRPETVARIARGGFTEAIVLPGSFSAALLAYRARIPERVGYRGDGRTLLLTRAVRRPAETGHQLRDYDALLRAVGAEPSTMPPRLDVPSAAATRARAALARAGIAIDRSETPLAGIFAAAEFGGSKRWPLERFAETARRVTELPHGACPVLIAGPKEKELLTELRRQTGTSAALGTDLDLADLAAVLAELDLLITNDSGPMHLAASVGTPCVALFGPTDPNRTSPCGAGHRVLYTSRWCSPCFRRRCPLVHQRCMREISVDEVLASSAAILGRRAAPRQDDQESGASS